MSEKIKAEYRPANKKPIRLKHGEGHTDVSLESAMFLAILMKATPKGEIK